MLVLTMELLLVLVLSMELLSMELLSVLVLVPLRGQPARSLMAPTARTTSTERVVSGEHPSRIRSGSR